MKTLTRGPMNSVERPIGLRATLDCIKSVLCCAVAHQETGKFVQLTFFLMGIQVATTATV